MAKGFLEKYRVEGIPSPSKALRVAKSPLELSREKLLGALEAQSSLMSVVAAGEPVPAGSGRRPRPFWREVSGQLYFTPRFGNEFLFGPNGGVATPDFPGLLRLVKDFAAAVSAGEFDEDLLRIASLRKGRGKGKSKSGNKEV